MVTETEARKVDHMHVVIYVNLQLLVKVERDTSQLCKNVETAVHSNADSSIMGSYETANESPLETLLLNSSVNDGDDASRDGTASANVKLELRGLLLLSAPVMVQLSAQYAVTVVNQYFIGHQGAGPLAAAAIGNTVSLNLPGQHVYMESESAAHAACKSIETPDK